MTTALVLSGGANLGAAQVGMMMALQESGVRPDLVIGTSAGILGFCWSAAPSISMGWSSDGTTERFPRVLGWDRGHRRRRLPVLSSIVDYGFASRELWNGLEALSLPASIGLQLFVVRRSSG